ncbi:hypothetical protein MNBD_GAMMA23-333 [hydrothermal vent metagenome]|uniref:Glycosyl transferase family 1 domain-containing protein n=1 Tax=hydrothermal vent metagenome TaxID=652676 RepID=A0A3B0ZH61_9ZZZZ
MKSILIMFHCDSNVRYAIDTLLQTFYKMAKELVIENECIHISFVSIKGSPRAVLDGMNSKNLFEFEPATKDKAECEVLQKYVQKNNIDTVFGFDMPINRKCYKYLRNGGVKKIVSYWGAPISGLNSGFKLWMKKLEVALLYPHSPDIYIFESDAMANTASMGRGISKRKIKVVPLGVDTDKYKPDSNLQRYTYEQFNIPEDRKILYYSGHMEQRKGVSVLMNMANHLSDALLRDDYHLLILGNRAGEADGYVEMLKSKTLQHVTFAGYRDDVEKILPSCYLGIIASTGWDSFTVSSLEMASAGLPLIVSDLQGLSETIDEGVTGFKFTPGEHMKLAKEVVRFLDDVDLQLKMSVASRQRIINKYSTNIQLDLLQKIVAV